MNILRVAVLLFAFAVAVSRAADTNALPTTITIDGVQYQDVRWGTVTPATVTVFHKSGIATIPLWKLPPDLQKQFGYDPQTAGAWQKVEQQTRLREEQYTKYRTEKRLLLDGRLVEANQVTEMNGTVISTPASIKGNDGRTYRGTILEGTTTKVSGYNVANVSAFEGESHAVAIPTLATAIVHFFVKDFFPTNSIGSNVSFRGALINPIAGQTTWAVAKNPSFEEWRKLQQQK